MTWKSIFRNKSTDKKREALKKIFNIVKQVDGIHSNVVQHSAFAKIDCSSWNDKRVNDSYSELSKLFNQYKK